MHLMLESGGSNEDFHNRLKLPKNPTSPIVPLKLLDHKNVDSPTHKQTFLNASRTELLVILDTAPFRLRHSVPRYLTDGP
jgi:hypothetical protein